MQGLAQLLTIILIVFTFIIGLFFIRKLKVFRYIFHGISAILLIGLIINPYMKSESEKEIEKEIVGIYHLDLENSNYSDKIELEKYLNVNLIVKEDNTFKTSSNLPILESQSGTWEVKDNGDFTELKIKFDGSKTENDILENFTEWTFENLELKNKLENQKITFKK